MDKAGNLYGTTVIGGTMGYGTVFKLDAKGNETVLLDFDLTEGADPTGGVIIDRGGSLFGTALEGPGGSGVVFQLKSGGKDNVLYAFQGGQNDKPKVPEGGVISDSSGNLYGVTLEGGKFGAGTVFKLARSGTLTILYAFKGNKDGRGPVGGVIMDAAGNLYGTTDYGGDPSCNLRGSNNGCGVVFRLDPSGNETVLHAFATTDGAFPAYGGLRIDADGILYGADCCGGDLQCDESLGLGCGTIYKLDESGNFSVLYTFTDPTNDGELPNAGLVEDGAGNLYGTTTMGGQNNNGEGTLFKLDISSNLTIEHNFTGNEDGAEPYGGLLQDSKGNLYGCTITQRELHKQWGVVFKFKP